jgi:hypothetical protein
VLWKSSDSVFFYYHFRKQIVFSKLTQKPVTDLDQFSTLPRRSRNCSTLVCPSVDLQCLSLQIPSFSITILSGYLVPSLDLLYLAITSIKICSSIVIFFSKFCTILVYQILVIAKYRRSRDGTRYPLKMVIEKDGIWRLSQHQKWLCSNRKKKLNRIRITDNLHCTSKQCFTSHAYRYSIVYMCKYSLTGAGLLVRDGTRYPLKMVIEKDGIWRLSQHQKWLCSNRKRKLKITKQSYLR